MKSKFYFLILFLFCFRLFSQEYHPLLNNSSWTVEVYDIGFNQTFSVNPVGEQIIGEYTYKKFVDSFLANEIFIREDIAAKKVYKVINGQDVLLFDFNLQVSSPITLSNGQNYIVTSITNVNVNGGQRKRFYLTNQSTFPSYDEIWIEGVGNGEHPLLARYEYFSDPVFYLKCSFQNGESIYNMGLANNGLPSDCEILNVVENTFESSIDFSPNPFQQELTISSSKNLKNAVLKIYNIIGQEVKIIEHINGKTVVISRENLKAGIYVFKIQNENNFATRKIIVSD